MAFLYLFGYWVEGAQFHVVEILNSIGIKSPKSCTDICYVHWGWTPMLVVFPLISIGLDAECRVVPSIMSLGLGLIG
jgi:hypothetical protein